jgi:hypothetical protein
MKKFAIGFGAFLLAVFIFLAWMGAFSEIEVRESTVGPMLLVYKTQQGNYRQTRGTVKQALRYLDGLGLKSTQGFGLFHDDPRVVPETELRSEAGAVLEVGEESNITQLPEAFASRIFPAQKSLTAVFPLKNFLSIYIGLMKAYPKLSKELEARGSKPGSAMEIYNSEAGTITYVFAL